MTHDELLVKIKHTIAIYEGLSALDTRVLTAYLQALRAVVELHKPFIREDKLTICNLGCNDEGGYLEEYPCPTIQAIEGQLE